MLVIESLPDEDDEMWDVLDECMESSDAGTHLT